MKQTAVELYAEEFAEHLEEAYGVKITSLTLLKKAKEMEKQQIIETYIECKRQYVLQENCYPPQFVVKEAEQYYNEQFKNK